MKKNKLYTVNKGNIYAFGDFLNKDSDNYMGNWLGASKLSEGAGGMIGSLGSVVGGAAKNILSGGYNSGAGNAVAGLTNTIGGALSKVNPVLGSIVQVGGGIIGGGINAAFGSKVDQEKLSNAKAGIATLNNFTSNAESFDDIKGPSAVTPFSNPYKSGFLNRGKARKQNTELRNQFNNALAFADRSVENNIDNIASNQMSGLLANYSAFGGPLDYPGNTGMGAIDYGFMNDYLLTKRQQNEARNKMTGMIQQPTFTNGFAEGGDIHIKPSHRGRLTELKERTGKTEAELYNDGNPAHKKMVVFARNARKWNHALGGPLVDAYCGGGRLFAIGGDTQTNGADWSTKMKTIGAGGTHEENIYDGVQLGRDNEGVPNLVEEGETVFDDYVYSNRIYADGGTLEKFHLPKKAKLTFADITKKLEKQVKERENDPIAQAGFKAEMFKLRDEQERQKAEMEAERARAAFEALSPEEQTAVMQGVEQAAVQQQAIENAAAQEAIQQPSQEEMLAAQQQMADGSVPNVGQEPQIMAEGGNLFPKGGIIPYAYSNSWDGFDYFNPETNAYDEGYLNFVNGINQDWVDRIMKGQYGSMDRYLAKNKGTMPTIEQVRRLASDKKYSDMHKAMAAAYKEYLAGIDPKTGQPTETVVTTPSPASVGNAAGTPAPSPTVTPNGTIYHTVEGEDDYLEGDPSTWNGVGAEVRREVLPNGDTVVYHSRLGDNTFTEEQLAQQDNNGTIRPKHRPEWMRYAGLFGPAVGLGMQALGIGKPDYSGLNAAVAAGSTGLARADYQPIGNYLTYRPLDIWAEQNRLDATSRATDRNIMNTSGGNRGTAMAGLIANGHNSQLASGNLFRQSQEYNDALRKQVEEFNRGTDMFNAEAYNRNSQFNADAVNRNRQFNAQLQMEAARQKMAADADWYNSLYGNVSGLFRGLGNLGTENYRMNRIAEMAADSIFGNLGRSNTGSRWIEIENAKGGKLKKKGKRGLTI